MSTDQASGAAAPQPPMRLARTVKAFAMVSALFSLLALFGGGGGVLAIGSFVASIVAYRTAEPARASVRGLRFYSCCSTLSGVAALLVLVATLSASVPIISCACSSECAANFYASVRSGAQAALARDGAGDNATAVADAGVDAFRSSWAAGGASATASPAASALPGNQAVPPRGGPAARLLAAGLGGLLGADGHGVMKQPRPAVPAVAVPLPAPAPDAAAPSGDPEGAEGDDDDDDDDDHHRRRRGGKGGRWWAWGADAAAEDAVEAHLIRLMMHAQPAAEAPTTTPAVVGTKDVPRSHGGEWHGPHGGRWWHPCRDVAEPAAAATCQSSWQALTGLVGAVMRGDDDAVASANLTASVDALLATGALNASAHPRMAALAQRLARMDPTKVAAVRAAWAARNERVAAWRAAHRDGGREHGHGHKGHRHGGGGGMWRHFWGGGDGGLPRHGEGAGALREVGPADAAEGTDAGDAEAFRWRMRAGHYHQRNKKKGHDYHDRQRDQQGAVDVPLPAGAAADGGVDAWAEPQPADGRKRQGPLAAVATLLAAFGARHDRPQPAAVPLPYAAADEQAAAEENGDEEVEGRAARRHQRRRRRGGRALWAIIGGSEAESDGDGGFNPTGPATSGFVAGSEPGADEEDDEMDGVEGEPRPALYEPEGDEEDNEDEEDDDEGEVIPGSSSSGADGSGVTTLPVRVASPPPPPPPRAPLDEEEQVVGTVDDDGEEGDAAVLGGTPAPGSAEPDVPPFVFDMIRRQHQQRRQPRLRPHRKAPPPTYHRRHEFAGTMGGPAATVVSGASSSSLLQPAAAVASRPAPRVEEPDPELASPSPYVASMISMIIWSGAVSTINGRPATPGATEVPALDAFGKPLPNAYLPLDPPPQPLWGRVPFHEFGADAPATGEYPSVWDGSPAAFYRARDMALEVLRLLNESALSAAPGVPPADAFSPTVRTVIMRVVYRWLMHQFELTTPEALAAVVAEAEAERAALAASADADGAGVHGFHSVHKRHKHHKRSADADDTWLAHRADTSAEGGASARASSGGNAVAASGGAAARPAHRHHHGGGRRLSAHHPHHRPWGRPGPHRRHRDDAPYASLPPQIADARLRNSAAAAGGAGAGAGLAGAAGDWTRHPFDRDNDEDDDDEDDDDDDDFEFRRGGPRQKLRAWLQRAASLSEEDYAAATEAVCTGGPVLATLAALLLLAGSVFHFLAAAAARKLARHPVYVAADQRRRAIRAARRAGVAYVAPAFGADGGGGAGGQAAAAATPDPTALYTFVPGRGFVALPSPVAPPTAAASGGANAADDADDFRVLPTLRSAARSTASWVSGAFRPRAGYARVPAATAASEEPQSPAPVAVPMQQPQQQQQYVVAGAMPGFGVTSPVAAAQMAAAVPGGSAAVYAHAVQLPQPQPQQAPAYYPGYTMAMPPTAAAPRF